MISWKGVGECLRCTKLNIPLEDDDIKNKKNGCSAKPAARRGPKSIKIVIFDAIKKKKNWNWNRKKEVL